MNFLAGPTRDGEAIPVAHLDLDEITRDLVPMTTARWTGHSLGARLYLGQPLPRRMR